MQSSTTYPDAVLSEPAHSDPIRRLKFLLTIAQLGLALWVVNEFAIEERRHLPAVLALAVAGFGIHCWLPLKLRMPFFLALSLASIFLVLPLQDAMLVLGLGMGLIAICWLPVAAPLRIALLLLAAGLLAYWRSGSERVFWPILGAMFMFRLIVYVFDTLGQKQRDPLPTLSYFFLLPNACFTLFPVIDYATFRRTYYDSEEFSIYQTGIHWICRGLTHLLLYRWIKYHILPMPYEIDDPADVALFLAANYALYLHVSGQFHLITGLLHLFGFNLPRTHHLFFLATSFTDIWRRINIYWKDFMQKVLFMPVFLRLRALGTVPALIGATASVFLATWLLHSYQVFWLLGDFPLRASDGFLWLSAGALVALNGLADCYRARRGGASSAWSWTHAAVRSLQVIGMFSVVSLFWGRWTHPQILDVLAATTLPASSATILPGLAAIAVGTVAIGAFIQWVWFQLEKHDWSARLSSPGLGIVGNVLLLLVLIAATRTDLYRSHFRQLAMIVDTLRQDVGSPLEESQLVRGYYEQIDEASLQSHAFVGAADRDDPNRYRHFVEMTRPTGDMLQLELVPGWKGELEGSPLSVNRWGMRDRELAKSKPPGIRRVAMVGSSIVMGYGVRDEQVFDVLLEESLNITRVPGAPRFELLNFGVGRYYAIHRRLQIKDKVFEFRPDAIYYFAHQDELMGPPRHLADIVFKEKLPDACLDEIVRQAGLTPETAAGVVLVSLSAKVEEILLCCYRSIVRDCRDQGVLPVWVYFPIPGVGDEPGLSAKLIELAERAGFEVIDLTSWADGYRPEDVKVDLHHANALAHRQIAHELHQAIRQRPLLLPGYKPRASEEPSNGPL